MFSSIPALEGLRLSIMPKTISHLINMRNTSPVKSIIQIQGQLEEEYFIVPPNPMVARRMKVVVFRLDITGVTTPKVLFSAVEHPTFPITIHLSSQLTVVDGREVVYLESAVTAEEYQTIKEQSVSRVNVPQMHVNLEQLFPSRSFSPPMLY